MPVRTERNSFHSSARPPRPRRSGISLIEVLIAVFVLTFGLMGIAMVIPAGRYLMVEAAKSDRGSACGRAALNDMKIRGWLLPGQSGSRLGKKRY
ncbi:MAG: type IV pilus modification PilV family protein [Thermoguttaceae bacterium]